jgi:hypothetical protein
VAALTEVLEALVFPEDLMAVAPMEALEVPVGLTEVALEDLTVMAALAALVAQ